jgi:hypothetical protein
MMAFPPPEQVLALLAAAGFQALQHRALSGGLVNLFVVRTPVSGGTCCQGKSYLLE